MKNNMKYLISLLSLFLIFSCTNKNQIAKVEKPVIIPSNGVVEYSINLEQTKQPLDEATKKNFGTTARTTFNKETLHFQKLDGQDTESFQLVDLASGQETNYLTFRGNKFALVSTPEMIPPIGQLTLHDESKTILGYSCKKGTATMGDGMMEVWYTNEIGANFCPYIKAPGFALQYTMNMGFARVTYTATNVSIQPIDGKLLIAPADYKKVTMKELQQELMGGAPESSFKKGEELSNFELSDMNGQVVKLNDLRGKVVLLNFWFINCPPCRAEMPDLNELKTEYANKDVEFIGITFDNKSNVEAFLKTLPFEFQIIPDARKIIQEYGIMGFPTSVVLDRKGKIVDSKLGGSMNIKEELKAFIEEALE